MGKMIKKNVSFQMRNSYRTFQRSQTFPSFLKKEPQMKNTGKKVNLSLEKFRSYLRNEIFTNLSSSSYASHRTRKLTEGECKKTLSSSGHPACYEKIGFRKKTGFRRVIENRWSLHEKKSDFYGLKKRCFFHTKGLSTCVNPKVNRIFGKTSRKKTKKLTYLSCPMLSIERELPKPSVSVGKKRTKFSKRAAKNSKRIRRLQRILKPLVFPRPNLNQSSRLTKLSKRTEFSKRNKILTFSLRECKKRSIENFATSLKKNSLRVELRRVRQGRRIMPVAMPVFPRRRRKLRLRKRPRDENFFKQVENSKSSRKKRWWPSKIKV